MVNIGAGMLLAWSWPNLYRVPPWRGYFKNQQEVDEILYAEIRERRAAHDLEGRARRAVPACCAPARTIPTLHR